MKKSLTKIFTLIALAGVVFFSSCGSKDDATTPSTPTLTLKDAGDGKYEVGDKATYALTATIPGGFKAASFTKTVGGVESAATQLSASNIAAGDTIIPKAGTTVNLVVDVTEKVGDQVTIKVTIIDNSDQNTEATASYTVVAVGQGGGGAAPLLRGKATVILGSESVSSTKGSYLATSKGTNGVFKSSEARANQADIDITFGIGNTGGPSLISPDQRTSVNLNAGNPAMTAARTTFFKAEASGPTDLGTVTALNVENNISASTAKNVQIAANKTYSFVQQGTTGKKGYIRVLKITTLAGTNNQEAEIEFVVQQ